jgi:SAM-dependent methyltransferase
MNMSRLIRRTAIALGSAALLTACASADKTADATPATEPAAEPTAEAAAEAGEGHEGGHDMHGEHGDAEHAYKPGEHHGHHRFDDAEKWAKRFENPERDAWQKPDVVIGLMDLKGDSVVADIGAATGYFPVRIAPKVPEGKVFGIDIEEDMVRFLAERAEKEGIKNLHAVKGEPADPKLPEPVDVVLLVNTVHHIEGRTAYFENVKKNLKPGGRVVIVDFKMGELPMGPPEKMRLAPKQVAQEFESAGYGLTKRDEDSLPHQYVLVFTPHAS